MGGFSQRAGALVIDAVSLAAIADGVGTPAYVYSATMIRERIVRLRAALEGVPHHLLYSLKANACRGVLTVIRASGCGCDVVSGGELAKALAAGFAPSQIIFGGVGKQAHELREALKAGITLITNRNLLFHGGNRA